MSSVKQQANDFGLLLMRFMLGMVFVFHGAQKLFGWFDGPGIQGAAGFFDGIGIPFPVVSAVAAGSAEFFGGLVLFLGTGTRVAAAFLFFTMFVASFVAHSGFAASGGGMEFPLTLGVVSLGLVLTGPGNFTLLALFNRKSVTGSWPTPAAAGVTNE